jgi:hypothetical protein
LKIHPGRLHDSLLLERLRRRLSPHLADLQRELPVLVLRSVQVRLLEPSLLTQQLPSASRVLQGLRLERPALPLPVAAGYSTGSTRS